MMTDFWVPLVVASVLVLKCVINKKKIQFTFVRTFSKEGGLTSEKQLRNTSV
jgi:hypothetical protein